MRTYCSSRRCGVVATSGRALRVQDEPTPCNVAEAVFLDVAKRGLRSQGQATLRRGLAMAHNALEELRGHGKGTPATRRREHEAPLLKAHEALGASPLTAKQLVTGER